MQHNDSLLMTSIIDQTNSQMNGQINDQTNNTNESQMNSRTNDQTNSQMNGHNTLSKQLPSTNLSINVTHNIPKRNVVAEDAKHPNSLQYNHAPSTISVLSPCIQRCICRDNPQFKYIVISASYLFKYMFPKCVNIQNAMYMFENGKYNSFIYLNNYTLFIDTVFRLLVMFKKLIKQWKHEFRYEKIVLINDLTPNDLPKRRDVYHPNMKRKLNEHELYKDAIRQLKYLSIFLTDEEKYDYDSWEDYLCQTYKADYHFSLWYPNARLSNYHVKMQYIKRFMFDIAAVQTQLTSVEMIEAFRYVMNVMKDTYKYIAIYKCKSGNFDINLVHLFAKYRTLYMVHRCAVYPNAFMYDFNYVYYPSTIKCIKSFEPDITVQLFVSRCKNKFRLIDLFDICERECHGRILDINDYMTAEIFKDIISTYHHNKLDTVKPEIFDEDEYSWVTKAFYENFLDDVIIRFKNTFEFIME